MKSFKSYFWGMRRTVISFITTVALLIGTVAGIPMHAYANPENYDLWVGGVRFTSDCLTIDSHVNPEFSGTATYNPTNNTLTLNNFSNGGIGCSVNGYYEGLYYGGSETLTIKIVGQNTFTIPDSVLASHKIGIYSSEASVDVTIEGTTFADSLYVDSGSNTGVSSTTVGIETAGDLLIKHCSLTAVAGNAPHTTNGIALLDELHPSESGTLTIDHASVTAMSGNLNNNQGIDAQSNFGICCNDSVTIKNGSIVLVSAGTVTNNIGMKAGIYTYGGFISTTVKLILQQRQVEQYQGLSEIMFPDGDGRIQKERRD